MTIQYTDMVAKLAKDGTVITDELTPVQAHRWHMATGIAGEVGELLEAEMTALADKQPIDMVNIVEELGDLDFYMVGLCQALSVNPELPFGTNTEHLGPLTLKLVSTSDHPLDHFNYIVMASAVSSQLLDLVKKNVVYQKDLTASEIMVKVNELNALINMIIGSFKLDRAAIRQANMDKLGKRYDGFEYTNTRAIERADKQ